MFRFLFLSLMFFSVLINAQEHEFTVDCADSYDELNCLYKDGAIKQETQKKNKKQPTSRKDMFNQQATVVASESLTKAASHSAGQVFNVGEVFNPLQTRLDAQDSFFVANQKMYQQMAHYCAQGWGKIREWSESTEQVGLIKIYYQFQCSSK